MCFGYDGEKALSESLERSGVDRRSVLRGAFGVGAAAAAAGVAGASPAAAAVTYQRIDPARISIQMYTLRDALGGEPGFDEMCRRLAAMGYQQVELAGYYGRSAADLHTFMDSVGLKTTSAHDGISANAAGLYAKIGNALTLEQKYMVVPYLNSASLSDWQRWADQMNAEARVARRAGLFSGSHNHAHEFTTDLGGGVTPWQVLMERLDPKLVHLEVDLYWVTRAGVELGMKDPVGYGIEVIDSAPMPTRQYHVKDRDRQTGDMCDLGTGHINFARYFRNHHVAQYIVENDTPDVTPTRTARVGFGYLKQLRY